jgi:hypothetical protein
MRTRILCKLGIAVGIGNYLLYAAMALAWGGDALHGHVAHGHYYLATNGAFVEASQSLFLFCKWLAYSLLLTFPLGLLGACFLTPSRREADEAEFTGGHGNARLSPHTA